MAAKDIYITGEVQEVFFRAETKKMANELGLTGWVRNLSDGSVEIHVEGSQDSIDELAQWCQEGPPAARVENVEVLDAEEIGDESFRIVED